MVNPNFLAGLWIVLRSSAVGLLATAADLAALALLVSGLGVDVRVASIPALCFGIGIQFVGNKLFAFGDKSKAWLRQGVQFMSVEAIGFGANILLFDLIVANTSLPYLPVRLVTTSLVYFGICLPLWSRIFKPELEEA